jgi:hypothetical protein
VSEKNSTIFYVHIFGESRNDVQSIKELVLAFNPHLTGRIRLHFNIRTIAANADPSKVRGWVERISNQLRAMESRYPAGAVVVHRDADRSDAQGSLARLLDSQLAPVHGTARIVAVVPVQETEAWWFLFPAAVEQIKPKAWAGCLPRTARDVELIGGPKEELQRRTAGPHKYTEADSPKIAQKIRELQPAKLGRSASFDRFEQLAKELT